MTGDEGEGKELTPGKLRRRNERENIGNIAFSPTGTTPFIGKEYKLK